MFVSRLKQMKRLFLGIHVLAHDTVFGRLLCIVVHLFRNRGSPKT